MRAFAAVVVAVVAVAGCGEPAPGPVVAATGREGPAARGMAPPAAGEVAVPAVFDAPPPVPAMKDVPPELAKEFELRNRRHERVAEARLTTTARWSPDPRLESHILVDWAIDYAGPRRPFAVITPGKRVDPTVGHFWYVKPDGTAARSPPGGAGTRRGRCRTSSEGCSRCPTAGSRWPAGW